MTSTISPILTISAQQLLAKYDNVTALDIQNLKTSGNIICIIGHNGSGKSTLIKMMLQLHIQKRGSIEINYQSPDDANSTEISQKQIALIPERDMAFSPENGAIFADISVEAYLRLWCRIKLSNPDYYRKEGSFFIEQLSLSHLLKKLGRELSKGERRRVQTAVGFMCDPKLFLFDEPFDGLDILQASNFAALLKRQSNLRTFLISSHRMSLVERIADQIVVLASGKVVTVGTTLEVCRALADSSFAIHLPLEEQELVSPYVTKLERALHPIAVNHIGSQIILSGKGLSTEKLREVCNELSIGIARIIETTPSLTDAMAYHLNSIAPQQDSQ